MEFKDTLANAQEARQLAASDPADLHVWVLIMNAINTAPGSLGYAVNGTTTPGSFIITW